MAKRKYVNIKTGPVTGSYCYLDAPDSGREFSDDRYKITLFLDPSSEDCQNIQRAVKQAADHEWPDGAPAGSHMPGKVVEADPDNPDKPNVGKMKFVFKTTNAPALSIRGNKPLPDGVKISGGDVVRVAGAAGAYVHGASKGVTLYLNQVRLVEKRVQDEFGDDDEEESGAADAPAAGEQDFNF